MADWIDESQEQQIKMLQEPIAQAISAPRRASAHFCEDCEMAIPEPRRKIIPGVQRCNDCQELNEIKRRNYRSI